MPPKVKTFGGLKRRKEVVLLYSSVAANKFVRNSLVMDCLFPLSGYYYNRYM